MGCDIHLVVEYREYESDRHYWSSFKFPMERRYVMFGLMAGVRGYDKLFEPRGMPEDVSPFITAREYKDWESDAHSCSYLTVDEFEQCIVKFKEICKLTDDDKGIIEESLLVLLKDMKTRFYDARIVFWFDN